MTIKYITSIQARNQLSCALGNYARYNKGECVYALMPETGRMHEFRDLEYLRKSRPGTDFNPAQDSWGKAFNIEHIEKKIIRWDT